MFDMNMFGKLNEMKQKMEEVKMRLDTVEVEGEAGDGAVKVLVTANKKVLDIAIDGTLLTSENKDQLQNFIAVAMNRALENAENVAQSEMKAIAGDLMPNLPGMFN